MPASTRATPPTSPVTVACFGEILWDCLPRGLFVGGAPFNAAYHLFRHGLRALPVSAVGRDFLGDEAVRRLAAWQMDARFVARDATRPTGIVRATLDAAGVPAYDIVRAVAWDRIAVPPALLRVAPDALVFGTLALRETPNRRALARLLAAWPHALRVVDLNFRAPFDGLASIAFALRHAQLVKLNDLELRQLTHLPVGTPRALERATRHFAQRHPPLARVCVTAGARGAGLLWDGQWFWENARRVQVRDTVGAGDAFLGALLAALLSRRTTPAAALVSACRMGEFIAARDGATPPYRTDARGRPHDLSA